MRHLILTILLILGATAVSADKFFIAIKLDMQVGRGFYPDNAAKRLRNNNAERVMQYMAGKKFDTLKDGEMYLLEEKRKTGSVMEFYGDTLGLGFAWNNYTSDNTTISEQWRCLQVLVVN